MSGELGMAYSLWWNIFNNSSKVNYGLLNLLFENLCFNRKLIILCAKGQMKYLLKNYLVFTVCMLLHYCLHDTHFDVKACCSLPSSVYHL